MLIVLFMALFMTMAAHVTAAPGATNAPMQQEREVTSIGDWSCQNWLGRHNDERPADPPQMWLVGFLSALASAHNTDVLAITNAGRIFTWMDKWCARNEGATISAGAWILFRDLRRQLPDGRPLISDYVPRPHRHPTFPKLSTA